MKILGWKLIVPVVAAATSVVVALVATGGGSPGEQSLPTVTAPAPTSTIAPQRDRITTTTTVSTAPDSEVPAYLLAVDNGSELLPAVGGLGSVSARDQADSKIVQPWRLPPLAERQAAEAEAARAAATAAAAEAAQAAVAPTTTVTPVVSPPTASQPVSDSPPQPVNNTAVFPGRGGVGYIGDPAALTVVESVATAPAGTSWDDSRKVLNVNSPDLILDHLFIRGGVDVYGGGTTTLSNSIVEYGAGDEMGILMRGGSGALVMTDTTIRRAPGTTASVGNGRGGVQISGGHSMTLLRNDISGLPDGMQLAGDNLLVAWNWIHDLAMVGSYPNNTHNDGIQLYSGSNITIANNRIEIGATAPYSNGALFFQGSGIGNVRIESNYLDGGGFPMRFETGTVSVINNVIGPNRLYGNKLVGPAATVVEWRDNLDLATGGAVTPP